MNRKSLKAIALGLGGLALALVLTVGAFAVAGQEISEPAGVPVFTTPGPGASGADTSRSPEPGRTESPSPSDDHGGDSGGSATDVGPDQGRRNCPHDQGDDTDTGADTDSSAEASVFTT